MVVSSCVRHDMRLKVGTHDRPKSRAAVNFIELRRLSDGSIEVLLPSLVLRVSVNVRN